MRRALGLSSTGDEAAYQQWRTDSRNAAEFDRLAELFEALSVHIAEPEILALRLAALQSAKRHKHGRRAVAAVLLMGIAGALWGVHRGSSDNDLPRRVTSQAVAERYESRVGEERKVLLDDGSLVTLNTGSLIEVSYSHQWRDVRLLRGQAFFKVQHNPAWPFVVTAGDRKVTATGTAFDVRVDGPQVRVTLVEGSVRVASLQPAGLDRLFPDLNVAQLSPGEQLSAREGQPNVTVTAADIDQVTSWTNDQLVFRDEDLATAIDEMNRYSTTHIVVDDPRIAALKVSGVFKADQMQDFLAAITTFYTLRTQQTAAGTLQLVWQTPRDSSAVR